MSERGRFVNIPTAAKVLGIAERTAYALVARNEFPVHVERIGRRMRVSTALLDRLLEREEVTA